MTDDLAEVMAEQFVLSATTGEYSEEALEDVVPEELGGPFLETSAGREFAHGVDESNPLDAEPEPLPSAVGGLAQPPLEAASDDGDED